MFWLNLLGTFIYYPAQITLGILGGIVLWIGYATIYVSLEKESENKIQGGNNEQ